MLPSLASFPLVFCQSIPLIVLIAYKMTALTQAYADRIARAPATAAPPEVAEVAVLGFTDAIGVMLAGAGEDAAALEYLEGWLPAYMKKAH